MLNDHVLHQEADRLIQETGILKLLEAFGELRIEGSYQYGTMVDRDIDVSVIVAGAGPDLSVRKQIVTTLLDQKYVWKLNMVDHANYTQLKNPKVVGIWIGLQIIHDEQVWNMDIWLQDEKHGYEGLKVHNRMLEITDSQRATILTIKKYCLDHNLKQKGQTSVDIYKAVLDDGVSTAEEYMASRQLD